jgi:hypothetical protein
VSMPTAGKEHHVTIFQSVKCALYPLQCLVLQAKVIIYFHISWLQHSSLDKKPLSYDHLSCFELEKLKDLAYVRAYSSQNFINVVQNL